MSRSVGGSAGSVGTTNATTISPRSSSGMPSTATSAIFGMRVEHVFDFLGRDVLALADDDVLDAAGDDDRAVLVEARHVAGVQPAVVGERVGVERAVDVAAHHLRALHHELAVVERPCIVDATASRVAFAARASTSSGASMSVCETIGASVMP